MERKPRHPRFEKLVNWKVLLYSYAYIGQIQMFFCWVMFFFVTPGMWNLYNQVRTGEVDLMGLNGDQRDIVRSGKTVYYWTLVIGQIAAAISTTTKLQSVFGFCGTPYCLPNLTLNIMFVGELALGLVAIYVPWMWSLFGTGYLDAATVSWPFLALFGICFIEEVRKFVGRIVEDADEGEDDETEGDESEDGSAGTEDGSGSEDVTRPLLC
mmetsp:Transcript_72650/g.201467  ORF Transcript_72650/g.201467 Transcript_72650/m.201467 type:complete len:211 (+) Transcript_72650:1-633(+)